MLADLKAGRDPGPRSEMLQAAWPVSAEERAEWAASNALALEGWWVRLRTGLPA